jgi:hypothetical protein
MGEMVAGCIGLALGAVFTVFGGFIAKHVGVWVVRVMLGVMGAGFIIFVRGLGRAVFGFSLPREEAENAALEYGLSEQADETILPLRDRIKKRLNFPAELPADYQPDRSVPVLTPIRAGDTPMVAVITNGGFGYNIPRVLFNYLYRQGSLTPSDRRVIDDVLGPWVLGPHM